MAYLLSFGKEPEERKLFEAFWIAYKAGDFPRYGPELLCSRDLKRDIKEKSIDGGSIKLAHCAACGQRVMQYPELRTLTEGQGFDLIVEKEAFEYIKTCLGKWERTFEEMQEPLASIYERLEDLKAKPLSDLQKLIADRVA